MRRCWPGWRLKRSLPPELVVAGDDAAEVLETAEGCVYAPAVIVASGVMPDGACAGRRPPYCRTLKVPVAVQKPKRAVPLVSARLTCRCWPAPICRSTALLSEWAPSELEKSTGVTSCIRNPPALDMRLMTPRSNVDPALPVNIQ